MAVFVPPISPSVKSSQERTYRTRKVDFGDGYEEVTGDGINNLRMEWSLNFDVLTPSEKDDILDFFDNLEGYGVFQYQVPSDSVQRNYRLKGDKIMISPKEGNLYEVSFDIREVFVVA